MKRMAWFIKKAMMMMMMRAAHMMMMKSQGNRLKTTTLAGTWKSGLFSFSFLFYEWGGQTLTARLFCCWDCKSVNRGACPCDEEHEGSLRLKLLRAFSGDIFQHLLKIYHVIISVLSKLETTPSRHMGRIRSPPCIAHDKL